MKRIATARMKGYIQPFEKVLALRELRAMSASEPREVSVEGVGPLFEFEPLAATGHLASRLAYWEQIEVGGAVVLTTQSLRESTVNLVRNGIDLPTLRTLLPFQDTIPLPNRRCLRYGTHGLHEYRGKFFPQLVRSLINIAGAKSGEVIADPMSGSGTTVVEAILAGCHGKGLDMNPLSVYLGNAKSLLLSANAESLATSYTEIREDLLEVERREPRPLAYFGLLPREDRDYLENWFSGDALVGLDEISCAIARLNDGYAQTLARVALSNIIRKVSWQKLDDLRVRKEVRLDIEIDPKKEFLEELGRSVRAVLAFLYQNGPAASGQFDIQEGDARECGSVWSADSVDLVITSPPYATALPYLDTDRLSLCYLGLLPRPEHRVRDQRMIGNREVSERQRKDCWERYVQHRQRLPSSIQSLIDSIESLNSGTAAGFRRKNLPALLSKYFFDMTEVLAGVKHALKPGHMAFVVVGNNHTIAGGQRVEIRTASLLQDIADRLGFEVAEPLSMDMLVSRDIFRRNAMASEEILAFRKPL